MRLPKESDTKFKGRVEAARKDCRKIVEARALKVYRNQKACIIEENIARKNRQPLYKKRRRAPALK